MADGFPWRAIGVEQGKGAEWFYLFEVHGQQIRIRSALITAPATILTVDPDADRWRLMFPHERGRHKFDHLKAAGFLIRECWAAQVRADEARKAAGAQSPTEPEPTAGQTAPAPAAESPPRDPEPRS